MCGPPRLRGRLHDNNMCTQLGSGKDDQLCSLAVSSYLTSTNGSSLPPPSLSLPSQEVDCHGNGGWNKPWKNSKQRSTESFLFLPPPPILTPIFYHTPSYPPSYPLMGTYSPSHFLSHFLLLLLLPLPLSLFLLCPSQESGTSCSFERKRMWLRSRHDNLSAVVSHLSPGPEKLLKAMETRNLVEFV